MVAWIGWHGVEPHVMPTIAGQAYVGRQGTQRAELKAAVYGLQACLNYVTCGDRSPYTIVLHVDNRTVANLLSGRWTPNELRAYSEAAQTVITALNVLGVSVQVVEVEEKHAVHRRAHQMSQNAWNQVLIEVDWRPV